PVTLTYLLLARASRTSAGLVEIVCAKTLVVANLALAVCGRASPWTAGAKPKEPAVLRDESGSRGSGRRAPRNVLGEPLDLCSITPMTGFYRDGCCNTGQVDVGSRTVCAVMTAAFLDFSKCRGHDLS